MKGISVNDGKVTKQCPKCLETKLLLEFSPRSTGGWMSWCKSCTVTRTKQSRHKIDESQLQSMFELQTSCAICGSTSELHIDHSHESGSIRELLCMQCNTGLGNFKENPEILQKAIDYLTKHTKVRV